MSSCQNESEEEKEAAKVRSEREQEIYSTVKPFLKEVVFNLCVPEGISGKIDLAFAVDRKRIIAKALIEIGKEIENGTDDIV